MAEAPDINVDELRRRARRRLIGAVVLALAAAVVVPMLLESDPKPLGEDVSVKIPQQDNDKFVNRLSDKNAKTGTAAPAATSEAKTTRIPTTQWSIDFTSFARRLRDLEQAISRVPPSRPQPRSFLRRSR